MEVLRSLPLFSALSHQQYSQLPFRTVHLACNACILHAGLVYVQEGVVSVCHNNESNTLHVGDCFGHGLLLSASTEAARIAAVEPSTMVVLDTAGFQQLLQSDLSFCLALLQTQSPSTAVLGLKEKRKMSVFSAKDYDRDCFGSRLASYQRLDVQLAFIPAPLTADTLNLCCGSQIICLFVQDTVDATTAVALRAMGVRLIALRCTGTNNIDLDACSVHGIQVASVPGYAPHSVAEHALGLMLALDRRLPTVYTRAKEGDFTLNRSLLGFEMKGKTVGIVGTGRIGSVLCQILLAMQCTVLCYDVKQNPELLAMRNLRYVGLAELYAQAHVISLHAPLTRDTHHMIDETALLQMRNGVVLVNTSRGALIDTKALVRALKMHKIGGAALDVYEGEADYFYKDWSQRNVLEDDMLVRLMSFHNVMITCHQGFFTQEALEAIADSVLCTVEAFVASESGRAPRAPSPNSCTV